MMKNKRIRLLFSFTLLFSLFIGLPAYAAEHKLENLHIHVFIHKDGSATITEERKATLSEGTENYIVIGNLGKSRIQDFTVIEEGVTFHYVEPWDLNLSREDKAFKNGIIEEANHYELSWGIGDYGPHNYVVQYTITDFIKQLDDSQILFWRFVNDQTNIPPEHVTVEIETDKALSNDEEGIWAFGFEGDIQFVDGKVIATSDRPLTEKNYVTVLVKFPDGQFGTTDILNKTFEDLQDEAFKGSDYGREGSSSSIFDQVIEFIKSNFFVILFIVFIFYNRFKRRFKKSKRKRYKRQYEGEYYRDIPYDGNIVDPYYMLYNMGATEFEYILSAFILKWIKEERISVVTEEKGLFKKESVATIYIQNKEIDESTLEGQLFSMFKRASTKDGKVDQEGFSSSVSKYRSSFNRWEKDVKSQSYNVLKGLNYIEEKETGRFIFKRKVDEPTAKGDQFEKNVHQYINYLHDFSLLNEHEPVNVKIWDDIMIWAAVLGLTDLVYDQFKQLYPQYETESLYPPHTVSAINSYSRSASTARTEAIRTSGGGGSTSVGGGGGSFGGGSGGGTR